MLNSLRLKHGFDTRLFHDNTGLSLNEVLPTVKQARDRGLLALDGEKIVPTELGFRHLNDLQALFLTPAGNKNKPFFESTAKIIHN